MSLHKLASVALASIWLLGCAQDGSISAKTHTWECSKQECTIAFSLKNDSTRRARVAYVLRAHRVTSIPDGDGARRNEIVGELRGDVELLGLEERQMINQLQVRARPTQIVASVWLPE